MEFTKRHRHIRRVSGPILINKRVAHDDLIGLLTDPDRIWKHEGIITDHVGKNRIGHGTLPMGLARQEVFIKEFLPKSLLYSAVGIFRQSSATRSYLAGAEMKRRGLLTPEPLAAVTIRRMGVVRRDVIITDYLPEAVSIRALCDRPERHEEILSAWSRETILTALGRLMRQMAETRVCHRDLSLRNVMIQRPGESPPAMPSLWIIDLNRALTLTEAQWKPWHSCRNYQRFRLSPEDFDLVLRSHFPDEQAYQAEREGYVKVRQRHLMVKRAKKRVRGGGKSGETTPQA